MYRIFCVNRLCAIFFSNEMSLHIRWGFVFYQRTLTWKTLLKIFLFWYSQFGKIMLTKGKIAHLLNHGWKRVDLLCMKIKFLQVTKTMLWTWKLAVNKSKQLWWLWQPAWQNIIGTKILVKNIFTSLDENNYLWFSNCCLRFGKLMSRKIEKGCVQPWFISSPHCFE